MNVFIEEDNTYSIGEAFYYTFPSTGKTALFIVKAAQQGQFNALPTGLPSDPYYICLSDFSGPAEPFDPLTFVTLVGNQLTVSTFAADYPVDLTPIADDKIVDLTADGTTLTLSTEANEYDVTLSKYNVELGNVDNTSDANKPISSATQTALNLKQDRVLGNTYTLATTYTALSATDTVNQALGKLERQGTNTAGLVTSIERLEPSTGNQLRFTANAIYRRTTTAITAAMWDITSPVVGARIFFEYLGTTQPVLANGITTDVSGSFAPSTTVPNKYEAVYMGTSVTGSPLINLYINQKSFDPTFIAAPATSGTVTIAAAGRYVRNYTLTPSGAVTLALTSTGMLNGATGRIKVTQGATPYAVNLPNAADHIGTTTSAVSVVAGRITDLSWEWDGAHFKWTARQY